jgi:hypothetical protein
MTEGMMAKSIVLDGRAEASEKEKLGKIAKRKSDLGAAIGAKKVKKGPLV